jgi:protein involved in polysaccharide export with SLBB domain
MLPIWEFVGTLAVAGKSFKEIQENVKNSYGDKAIKRTQIYDILKKVKDGNRWRISAI